MKGGAAFIQGFACALAELNRQHDQPSMVCDVMRGYGVDYAALVAAKVEDYDLRELVHCLDQGNASDRAQVHRVRAHIMGA